MSGSDLLPGSLPLFQAPLVVMPQNNPIGVIIGVVVVVVIVAVLFLVFGGRGRPTSVSGGSRYTASRFRRAARLHGLDKIQTKTLENMLAKYPMAAPFTLFTRPSTLDTFLGRAIADIDQQSQADAVREGHKATLFRIKQLIEQNSQKGSVSESSQLSIGQEVTLVGPEGTRHPSRVNANLRDYVSFDVPLAEDGSQLRWKKWSPLRVFAWKANGQAYSFETKVGGYSEVKGVDSLLIQQTSQVTQAVQRKYRRRQLEKPAYFYAVQIMTITTGRAQKKRAVPQTRGSLGTVLEISGGGCSVRTSLPLAKGSLVKIEFETTKGRPVVVFGKVKDVQRSTTSGSIMHVMFTQVSKKNLNKINQYVYEIG